MKEPGQLTSEPSGAEDMFMYFLYSRQQKNIREEIKKKKKLS